MRIIGYGFIAILLLAGCKEEGKSPERVNELYVEGPHIMKNGDSASVIYFSVDNGSWALTEIEVAELSEQEFTVDNPLDEPFVVRVSDESENISDMFPAASRVTVISDIEGNFIGLYSLLVAHKVIDQNGDWIYGDGHLVMLGDLFDRGPDVTPTLWLLYKLEAEARSTGGHVHIVLGNHEIMIFNGDTRYVNSKYQDQSSATGIDYTWLYSMQTVLGRWLRSKPAIIKIGDLLLSHAGVSPDVLELELGLQEINDIVRNRNRHHGDISTPEAETVFGNEGIFWYRGWVDYPPSEQVLDEILKKYNAGHLVLGHTIVPEIRAAYGHKIIMTDIRQYRDVHRFPIRALLVEDNSFYEINSRGERRRIKPG